MAEAPGSPNVSPLEDGDEHLSDIEDPSDLSIDSPRSPAFPARLLSSRARRPKPVVRKHPTLVAAKSLATLHERSEEAEESTLRIPPVPGPLASHESSAAELKSVWSTDSDDDTIIFRRSNRLTARRRISALLSAADTDDLRTNSSMAKVLECGASERKTVTNLLSRLRRPSSGPQESRAGKGKLLDARQLFDIRQLIGIKQPGPFSFGPFVRGDGKKAGIKKPLRPTGDVGGLEEKAVTAVTAVRTLTVFDEHTFALDPDDVETTKKLTRAGMPCREISPAKTDPAALVCDTSVAPLSVTPHDLSRTEFLVHPLAVLMDLTVDQKIMAGLVLPRVLCEREEFWELETIIDHDDDAGTKRAWQTVKAALKSKFVPKPGPHQAVDHPLHEPRIQEAAPPPPSPPQKQQQQQQQQQKPRALVRETNPPARGFQPAETLKYSRKMRLSATGQPFLTLKVPRTWPAKRAQRKQTPWDHIAANVSPRTDALSRPRPRHLSISACGAGTGSPGLQALRLVGLRRSKESGGGSESVVGTNSDTAQAEDENNMPTSPPENITRPPTSLGMNTPRDNRNVSSSLFANAAARLSMAHVLDALTQSSSDDSAHETCDGAATASAKHPEFLPVDGEWRYPTNAAKDEYRLAMPRVSPMEYARAWLLDAARARREGRIPKMVRPELRKYLTAFNRAFVMTVKVPADAEGILRRASRAHADPPPATTAGAPVDPGERWLKRLSLKSIDESSLLAALSQVKYSVDEGETVESATAIHDSPASGEALTGPIAGLYRGSESDGASVDSQDTIKPATYGNFKFGAKLLPEVVANEESIVVAVAAVRQHFPGFVEVVAGPLPSIARLLTAEDELDSTLVGEEPGTESESAVAEAAVTEAAVAEAAVAEAAIVISETFAIEAAVVEAAVAEAAVAELESPATEAGTGSESSPTTAAERTQVPAPRASVSIDDETEPRPPPQLRGDYTVIRVSQPQTISYYLPRAAGSASGSSVRIPASRPAGKNCRVYVPKRGVPGIPPEAVYVPKGYVARQYKGAQGIGDGSNQGRAARQPMKPARYNTFTTASAQSRLQQHQDWLGFESPPPFPPPDRPLPPVRTRGETASTARIRRSSFPAPNAAARVKLPAPTIPQPLSTKDGAHLRHLFEPTTPPPSPSPQTIQPRRSFVFGVASSTTVFSSSSSSSSSVASHQRHSGFFIAPSGSVGKRILVPHDGAETVEYNGRKYFSMNWPVNGDSHAVPSPAHGWWDERRGKEKATDGIAENSARLPMAAEPFGAGHGGGVDVDPGPGGCNFAKQQSDFSRRGQGADRGDHARAVRYRPTLATIRSVGNLETTTYERAPGRASNDSAAAFTVPAAPAENPAVNTRPTIIEEDEDTLPACELMAVARRAPYAASSIYSQDSDFAHSHHHHHHHHHPSAAAASDQAGSASANSATVAQDDVRSYLEMMDEDPGYLAELPRAEEPPDAAGAAAPSTPETQDRGISFESEESPSVSRVLRREKRRFFVPPPGSTALGERRDMALGGGAGDGEDADADAYANSLFSMQPSLPDPAPSTPTPEGARYLRGPYSGSGAAEDSFTTSTSRFSNVSACVAPLRLPSVEEKLSRPSASSGGDSIGRRVSGGVEGSSNGGTRSGTTSNNTKKQKRRQHRGEWKPFGRDEAGLEATDMWWTGSRQASARRDERDEQRRREERARTPSSQSASASSSRGSGGGSVRASRHAT